MNIGKIINALYAWDVKSNSLLNNVVDNPDDFSNAGGVGSLIMQEDRIGSTQDKLAGLESKYLSMLKAERRQWEKIDQVV